MAMFLARFCYTRCPERLVEAGSEDGRSFNKAVRPGRILFHFEDGQRRERYGHLNGVGDHGKSDTAVIRRTLVSVIVGSHR